MRYLTNLLDALLSFCYPSAEKTWGNRAFLLLLFVFIAGLALLTRGRW